VEFAEDIDQLRVDPLVDARMLRNRQLVEVAKPT
jgi:hypothetical protein